MTTRETHEHPSHVGAWLLADDGQMPNNPELALLVYRSALPLNDGGIELAERFEVIFGQHGWPPAWRYGVYDFHHYHSTAHEVLGVFRGRARLQLGGERGVTVDVEPGDVVIIPAGVGHRCLDASGDFCVVGAYPQGQVEALDTCRGQPGERPEVLERIARVPRPEADPVFGADGPLVAHWRA